MKSMSVFVDTTAWVTIIDKNNDYHKEVVNYFNYLLGNKITIVTNNVIIDETINYIKMEFGIEKAKKFNEIINESIINVKLRMDWISRRERRIALNSFLKDKTSGLDLRYSFISATLKKKKIDIIFTLDDKLKIFELPIMPQKK